MSAAPPNTALRIPTSLNPQNPNPTILYRVRTLKTPKTFTKELSTRPCRLQGFSLILYIQAQVSHVPTLTISFPNFPHFLSTFIVVMLTTSSGGATAAAEAQAVKGAYWPLWAASSFPPSAIETSFFTHIYFAFLVPNNLTFELEVPTSTASTLSNFASTLHRKNPPVKTLISIGGGGSDAKLFARIASDTSSRRRFILSTIEVARKFGLDGLDLDWESPASPKEMEDLGLLLEEWRLELEREAQATSRPRLLLAAAVSYAAEFDWGVRRQWPVSSIGKNLDMINAMCYDYHGSWDTSQTGAHAALFDPTGNLSTDYGLNSWIRAGVPRTKLVMGLPLYGRTWKLKDPKLHGIGAPAVDVGPGNDGTMTFAEVEAFNRENNATVVYDSQTVSTYSFAGTSWIGYDDVKSTVEKVKFAKAHGLSGYFFWAVNGDSQWKISRQASMAWNIEG